MHFSFIPVVKDKKKGIDKVSAYQLFNKTTLQKFHPALKEHLERTLNEEDFIELLKEALEDYVLIAAGGIIE